MRSAIVHYWLLNRRGGATPRACAPPLDSTAQDAEIVAASVAALGATGSAGAVGAAAQR